MMRRGVNALFGWSSRERDGEGGETGARTSRATAGTSDALPVEGGEQGNGGQQTGATVFAFDSVSGRFNPEPIVHNASVYCDPSDRGTEKKPLFDLVVGNLVRAPITTTTPYYYFTKDTAANGKPVYALRVTLPADVSEDGKQHTYGLRFRSKKEWEHVKSQIGDALIAARYRIDPTEANKQKHVKDGAHILHNTDPYNEPEAMDWEEPGEGTAGGVREAEALQQQAEYKPKRGESGSHRVLPGAMQNTFLMTPGGGVEVYRNKRGGLDDPNVHIETPTSLKQMMLSNCEQHAFCLSPESSTYGKSSCGRIKEVDFERSANNGKAATVADWHCTIDDVDVPIQQIVQSHKGGQTEESKEFHFVYKNRIGTFDARTREGVVSSGAEAKLSPSKHRDYSAKHTFSCIVSTGEGCFAVGDQEGGVALFDGGANAEGMTKIAKTRFPGFGSPITSIDATYDGNWVLATTDNYLLLIYTRVRTNSEVGGSAETTSLFRKGELRHAPSPRILRLSTADRARCGNSPLQHGHFTLVTSNIEQHERHIVATCGSAYVVFNLDLLKEELRPGSGNTTSTQCTVYFSQTMYADAALLHANYADDDGNDAIAAATETGSVQTSSIRRRLNQEFSDV